MEQILKEIKALEAQKNLNRHLARKLVKLYRLAGL